MSRIIAGRFRGRRLNVPAGQSVRPTTNRMRERVFSILMHGEYPDMHGARVADLFAGTGALGLEALSRGAEHVTFVEKSASSITCLKSNIAALKATNETNVLQVTARSLPNVGTPYDYIFMDPPYQQGLVRPTLDRLLEAGWIAPDTAIICELSSGEEPDLPPSIKVVNERSQGAQRVLFLSLASSA